MAEYRIMGHMYVAQEYKDYKRIIYEPGTVTRIILNRPRYKNAISHPLFGELENAFDRAAADPECRVIVISGAGDCFSGGDDAIGLTPESAPMLADGRTPEKLIKDYGSEKAVWHAYNDQHQYFIHDMWEAKIRHIPKPTIAMVHGYTIFMGFVIAAEMDIIFASDDALLLPAGNAGVWDLGPRKMLEIMYEHRFLTAREGYEYHLVNRIYPSREILEKETLAFANRVAENPTYILRNVKQQVHHLMDLQGYVEYHRGEPPYHETIYEQRGVPQEERSRHRYEGRGMARTPRAFANLKAKLESEGKEVPKLVLEALARAAARDDKALWQRALHQEWRDKVSIEAAEKEAKLYEEVMRYEKAEK